MAGYSALIYGYGRISRNHPGSIDYGATGMIPYRTLQPEETTMDMHAGNSACHAEGYVYPACLCTEIGREAIAADDALAHARIFGRGIQ